MIIVHGLIPIKPDSRDEALKMARHMAQATRLEAGCVSYDFYVGLSDPNTLMLFQEWESLDALSAHFQTQHMEEFLQGLPNVVAGEITTRRFAVQSVDEEQAAPEPVPPVIH
ncbi:MAG: putative quinol monooxygenase [Pseudomonadota bacterium]